MTELEKSFLKLQGYSDFEINNWNEEENWDFRQSDSFEMFKNGYAQGQKDMPYTSEQISENGRLKLENAELKLENAELKDGTILKELTEKCKQQAEQIEKMKNCPNCRFSPMRDEYKFSVCNDCNGFNVWELAK